MTTYPVAAAQIDELCAKTKLAEELANELVGIIDRITAANRALEVDLAAVRRRLAYTEMERDMWRRVCESS